MRRKHGATFSATEILDLQLWLRLGRRTRPHKVRVKLYTPRGHLYQTLTITDVGPRPGGKWKSKHRVGRWVSATIPVAGTMIVWGSLYGDWRAEFFLDDSVESCRAASFSIQP